MIPIQNPTESPGALTAMAGIASRVGHQDMSVITLRRFLAVLSLGLLAVLTACGTAATPSPIPRATAPAEAQELTKSDVNAWLDGHLPDALTNENIPGAIVVVVKDGQVITQRGYGLADIEHNIPVDPEAHIFPWASITKVPTSIAVMQLVEQGKIDLDADFATYVDVPVERRHDEPITIRHLLSHTGGFGEASMELNPDTITMPLAELVRYKPPVAYYRPGTTPAYSNYGIDLLGHIVETVSGQPFTEYMSEHVLRPADMATASCAVPLPAELAANEVTPHTATGERAHSPYGMTPSGCLAGSATDAGAFMLAQLSRSPELLSEESWEQMWRNSLGEDILGNFAASPQIGLGYSTGMRNGHHVVEHSGDMPGSHSQFEIYPDDGVGIFVSLNGEGVMAGMSIRNDLMRAFADRYLPGEEVASSSIDGSAERARQVAGDYQRTSTPHTDWNYGVTNLIASSKVEATEDGDLILAGTRYVEVKPWLWQAPGDDGPGATLTARITDGRAELSLGPAMALTPVTAHEQAAKTALFIGAAAMILTLIAWLRLRFARKHDLSTPIAPLTWLGRVARICGAFSALAVVGWVAAFPLAMQEYYANPVLLHSFQVAHLVGAIAIAPAAFELYRAVRGRTGWRRVTAVSLPLVGLIGITWWAIAGNMLNPDLGF
ncbi:MAG: serine hydrolase domain-containing protein [Propionibacteriaceae bacterium]|nr:serine hydrolase domain-containing protein [Propionibacteriaceae bacterium]